MKTINTLFLGTALAALGLLWTPARAQVTMDPAKVGGTKMADSAVGELSDGEVRKIDKAQGKVTLKHGEIRGLDMPAMTMVFAVRDKVMLDTVNPGDKVKFRAVDENGKLTVIEMKPAK